jgi:hypothetical protein
MGNAMIHFCLLAASVGLSLWGLSLMIWGMASRHWPCTQGEIIESEIRDYNEPSNYGYTFHVKYRFSAHGTTHVGTRIQYGLGSYLTKEAADALAERFAVGALIPVYHHPTMVAAVLERGFTRPTFFLLGVGLFLSLVVGYGGRG